LDSVGTRAFSVLTLIISVAALLCAVISLTADEKFLCVLISVSGGFGVILPIIAGARSKAARIDEEYRRDSVELFAEPDPIALVSWLLDPQRRASDGRSGA